MKTRSICSTPPLLLVPGPLSLGLDVIALAWSSDEIELFNNLLSIFTTSHLKPFY